MIFHFILHFTTNKTLVSLRCGHGKMHPVSLHLRPRVPAPEPFCHSAIPEGFLSFSPPGRTVKRMAMTENQI